MPTKAAVPPGVGIATKCPGITHQGWASPALTVSGHSFLPSRGIAPVTPDPHGIYRQIFRSNPPSHHSKSLHNQNSPDTSAGARPRPQMVMPRAPPSEGTGPRQDTRHEVTTIPGDKRHLTFTPTNETPYNTTKTILTSKGGYSPIRYTPWAAPHLSKCQYKQAT